MNTTTEIVISFFEVHDVCQKNTSFCSFKIHQKLHQVSIHFLKVNTNKIKQKTIHWILEKNINGQR
jgi:hypothetical protein